LECKVGIFEEVVHEGNEFAHFGGERNFGGFACGTQALLELFELTVGVGCHECGHVEGTADRRTPTPAAVQVDVELAFRVRAEPVCAKIWPPMASGLPSTDLFFCGSPQPYVAAERFRSSSQTVSAETTCGASAAKERPSARARRDFIGRFCR
jgi:hypothetical protein